MLLEALVACAGVTLKAVATAIGVELTLGAPARRGRPRLPRHARRRPRGARRLQRHPPDASTSSATRRRSSSISCSSSPSATAWCCRRCAARRPSPRRSTSRRPDLQRQAVDRLDHDLRVDRHRRSRSAPSSARRRSRPDPRDRARARRSASRPISVCAPTLERRRASRRPQVISTTSRHAAPSTTTSPHGEGRTKSASRIAMIRLMPGSMLPGRMAASLRKLVLSQIALGDPAVSPDGSCAALHASHHAPGRLPEARLGRAARRRAAACADGAATCATPRRSSPATASLFLRDEQVWAVPLARRRRRAADRAAARRRRRSLPHPTASGSRSGRGARDALRRRPARRGEEPLARVIDARRLAPRRRAATATATRTSSSSRRARGRAARRITRGDWSVDELRVVAGREAHRVLRRP